MTDTLNIAIENLYDIFSKYDSNPNMTGSPLYENLDKWNKALFSKPLRKLTSEDLSLFAGKVITTWGDTNDLKHFLPRLLELTALLDTPYDIWILNKKLEDAEWHIWDKSEQEAVNKFSLALWENLLLDNSKKAEREFPDYFATLAHFYPYFDQLTEKWQFNNCYSSIKHLTNYVYAENQYLFLKSYIRGNEKSTRNIAAFKSWLISEKVIQKLTDTFYQFENTELADKISWTLKILEDEKYSAQQRHLP